MKVIAITQARIGSTRLPAKVMMKIGEKTLLDIHLERLKQSKRIDDIVVATTNEPDSDRICDVASHQGLKWYKGSMDDVLDRFYQAALPQKADWVVRVTSDCPLLDPEVIDAVINKAIDGDYDYCSNILVEDFPDGQDVEVFKMAALEKSWKEATKKFEREHVTPYMRNNCDFNGGDLFTSADYAAPQNFNKVRMTIDEQADFDMMEWLINDMGLEKTWMEYTRHMLNNPDKLVNADLIRNEGYYNSINKEE